MKINIFILALVGLFLSCTAEKKSENQVITLSNGTVKIKILPSVGGTLVSASLAGHENILNSDSLLWNELMEKRPSMDPAAPYKAYNGMIVWLSPQSEWWVKQNDYPQLKKSRSQWPPDPYLTCAAYKITNQAANEITMESPESPFTHVQFTKNFKIEGNRIFITASARNCGKDTISWGLWFNTRMNGWDKVFVPADSIDLLKTRYMKYPEIHLPAFTYSDGCFSYQSQVPEDEKAVYKSKSFLNVENPVIVGYKNSQWLIIRGEKTDLQRIHPEQGNVEIYIENSTSKVNDLQELEMHFAYEKIAPGKSIQASQNWEIVAGSDVLDNVKLPEAIKLKLK